MGSGRTPAETDDVVDQGSQHLQAVPHPTRTAREIRDEYPPPDANQTSGESCKGCLFFAFHSKGLGQTGTASIQDRPGGFRSDVPRPETGSTGGDDDIDVSAIGPGEKNRNDGLGLIRDHRPVNDLIPLAKTPVLQESTTHVLPLAAATRVGYRENSETERR